MAIATTTAIAIGGLAIGAAGLGMQYYGQQQAQQANEQARAYQMQAEQERKKAMELDAMRRKREMVRQMIAQRSLSLSTATNQGAADGSGLQGAYGSASGRTGVNALGVNQNLEIGRNLFGINANISNALGQQSSWGSFANTGAGLFSLGGALIRNMDTINRVGTWLGGSNNTGGAIDYGSQTAAGISGVAPWAPDVNYGGVGAGY